MTVMTVKLQELQKGGRTAELSFVKRSGRHHPMGSKSKGNRNLGKFLFFKEKKSQRAEEYAILILSLHKQHSQASFLLKKKKSFPMT